VNGYQTLNIFEVVKCIGKTYGKLFEKIYEERPDIMDKLLLVRENMDEDMAKRIKWGFNNY